jgi:hypothetical protein
MSYNTSNTASAGDFMHFRGHTDPDKPYPDDQTDPVAIAAIIGYGYGTRGYGQLNTILPPKSPKNRIGSYEWNAMQAAMSNVNIHTGSNLIVQPRVSVNGRLIAEDGTDSSANIESLAETLDANRMMFDENQMTSIGVLSSKRTLPWTGNIVHEFTATFKSEDHARWYFNSGGGIEINAAGTINAASSSGNTTIVSNTTVTSNTTVAVTDTIVSPQVYPVTNGPDDNVWSSFMNNHAVWVIGDINGPDLAGQTQTIYRNFTAPYDGKYLFKYQADDIATIYIDNIVVGTTTSFKGTPDHTTMSLSAGSHIIKVEARNRANNPGKKWRDDPVGYALTIECVLWSSREKLDPEQINSPTVFTSDALYDIGGGYQWSDFMNTYACKAEPKPANFGQQRDIYRNFIAPYTGDYTLHIAAYGTVVLSIDGVILTTALDNISKPTKVVAHLVAGPHILNFNGTGHVFGYTSTDPNVYAIQRDTAPNDSFFGYNGDVKSGPDSVNLYWGSIITTGVLWDSRLKLAAETIRNDSTFTSPAVYQVTLGNNRWSTFMNTYAVWPSPAIEAFSGIPITIHRKITIPTTGYYTVKWQGDNILEWFIDDVRQGRIASYQGNPQKKTIRLTAGVHIVKTIATNEKGSGAIKWSSNPAGYALAIFDSNNNPIWDTRKSLNAELILGSVYSNVNVSTTTTNINVVNVEVFTNAPINANIAAMFEQVGTITIDSMNTSSSFGSVNNNGFYGLTDDYQTMFETSDITASASSLPIKDIVFDGPNNNNTYIVPDHVTAITVKLWGAGGGGGPQLYGNNVAQNGGAGAFVQATIPVTPGESLIVQTGGPGGAGINDIDPHTAGANSTGGGGGGYTGIFRWSNPLVLSGANAPSEGQVDSAGPTVWDTRSHIASEVIPQTNIATIPYFAVTSTNGDWNTFMNNNAVWIDISQFSYSYSRWDDIYRAVNVTTDGMYTFTYAVDDNLTVSLDGVSIITSDVSTSRANRSPGTVSVHMTVGVHILKFNVYNGPSHGGWALTITDPSSNVIWRTRDHQASEIVTIPSFVSPAVFAPANVSAWTSWLNSYSVWPEVGVNHSAPETFTIHRNYTATYSGNYVLSVAADNHLDVYVDNKLALSTDNTYKTDATTITIAMAAGPHIIRFVATNRDNNSPAGYALTITGPQSSGGSYTGVYRWAIPILIAGGGGGAPPAGQVDNTGPVIWDTRLHTASETITQFGTMTTPYYAVTSSAGDWNSFMNSNAVWVDINQYAYSKSGWDDIYRAVTITTAGIYKFTYAVDDNLTVSLDGVTIITSDVSTSRANHAPGTVSAYLNVGVHILKFYVYNGPSRGGWALTVTDPLNNIVWKTRDHQASESIVLPSFISPIVYAPAAVGGWSSWLNAHAVWPEAGVNHTAPVTYTIHRNFSAPYNGQYLLSAAADNHVDVYIDGTLVITTDNTYNSTSPTTATVSLLGGLHIIRFVATNRNNNSPAGYAFTITGSLSAGHGGSAGILVGSSGKFSDSSNSGVGGSQVSGGAGSSGNVAVSGNYLKGGSTLTQFTYTGGVNGGGSGDINVSGGGGGYYGGGAGLGTGGGGGGSSYIVSNATDIATAISPDWYSAPATNDVDYAAGVAIGGAPATSITTSATAGGPGRVVIYIAQTSISLSAPTWTIRAKREQYKGVNGSNGSVVRIASIVSSDKIPNGLITSTINRRKAEGVLKIDEPAFKTTIGLEAAPIPTPPLVIPPPSCVPYQLFTGIYRYDTARWTGPPLVITTDMVPINFTWNNQAEIVNHIGLPGTLYTNIPKEWCIRWLGYIEFPATGKWTISVKHSHGCWLWIDQNIAINADKILSTNTSTDTYTATFNAGQKYLWQLDMEHEDDSPYPFVVSAKWSGPGVTSPTIIPGSAFCYNPDNPPHAVLPIDDTKGDATDKTKPPIDVNNGTGISQGGGSHQDTGGGVTYKTDGTGTPSTVVNGGIYSGGKLVGTFNPNSSSGSGSSSSSGRVICTHFMRKGMLDNALWRADLEFTFKHLSAQTVRGYQFWAIPYVRLMRKSPLAEKFMLPFAKARAEELAYQLGKRDKGSMFGKLVRIVGESICYSIGAFVGEQDWESLWTAKGIK